MPPTEMTHGETTITRVPADVSLKVNSEPVSLQGKEKWPVTGRRQACERKPASVAADVQSFPRGQHQLAGFVKNITWLSVWVFGTATSPLFQTSTFQITTAWYQKITSAGRPGGSTAERCLQLRS
ncbi:hypothetical protein VULLAG_LOCUS15234 [Vulpes lagopus]